MKRILFVTSNNFSTNPRLLKEVKLALRHGYNITVLLFELSNWSAQFEKKICDNLESVEFIRLNSKSDNFLFWIYISILEKVLRTLPTNWLTPSLTSFAISKRSYIVKRALKKISKKFDLIVAHNPASFFPSVQFSIETKTKLGVDIEDYHPGETNNIQLMRLTEKLMKYTIDKTEYISFASPLFIEPVKALTDNIKINEVVVLNGFQASEFLNKSIKLNGKLKIVWYSQNISYDRGLEFVIAKLKKYSSEIELHLIGSLNSKFYKTYIFENNFINVHEPLEQSCLHKYLSNFDIGLAADIPVDINRNLAISNKIISYAQAGLYILASNTSGHRHFIKNYNFSAVNYSLYDNSFDEQIQFILSNIEEIRLLREVRIFKGKQFDWDLISLELLKKWVD